MGDLTKPITIGGIDLSDIRSEYSGYEVAGLQFNGAKFLRRRVSSDKAFYYFK
jgi:hypothetical protein